MSRDAYDAADDADDEPREVRVDEEVTDPDYGAQADLTGWSGPVSGNGSSEQGSMADPMDRRVRHGALGLDPEDRAGRLEPSGSGQQSVSPIGGSGVEGETHRQTRQSMDDQVTSVAEGQPAGNDESQRALEVPEALSPCTRKVGAADGVSASPDEQSRQQHQAFLESAGRAAASSPLGQASQAESGSRSGRDARLEELLEDVVMSMNFLSSRVQSLEEAKSSEQLVGGRQARDPSWVGLIMGALDWHYEALARGTNPAGEMPVGEARGLQPAITGAMSQVSPFQPLQGRSALLGASQGEDSRGLLGPIVHGNSSVGGSVGNPWLRLDIPYYRIDSPIQRAAEDPPQGRGPVGQVSEGSGSAQESFHSLDPFGPSNGLGMGAGALPVPSAPPGISALPPLPLPTSVQTSLNQGLEIGRGLR